MVSASRCTLSARGLASTSRITRRRRAIVQTYTCTGATNQLWNAEVVSYAGDGSMAMRLVNAGSGLCLDLVYPSTNPGVGVLQAPCTAGSTTQLWKIPGPSSTVPKIVYANGVAINYSDTIPNTARNLSNVASGLCLQPNGGGQVTQSTCSAALNWRLPLF